METPYLPQSIFGKDYENVYEPAEDTFLLLDALEKDIDHLKKKALVCLECGSGSGIVITAVSKTLGGSNRMLFATDINIEACKTTKKCALYHNEHSIQVVKTNLAESLVDRLENKVDLLIFNPPYVPTDNGETNIESQIQLSWAGGENGRSLIDIFLRSHVPRLLSKPDGVSYLVALDKNNPNELANFLVEDANIQGSIVMQRRAGIELLHVIKYEWIRATN